MIESATCRGCGKVKPCCHLQSALDMVRSGLVDIDTVFPGRVDIPLEIYIDDDITMHQIQGLKTLCSMDEFCDALSAALSSGIKDFHYATYFDGKIIHLNGRAFKIDSYRRRSSRDPIVQLAFTAEEIAQAGSPPIVILAATPMSDPERPRRTTTNRPELRPADLPCCDQCACVLRDPLSLMASRPPWLD